MLSIPRRENSLTSRIPQGRCAKWPFSLPLCPPNACTPYPSLPCLPHWEVDPRSESSCLFWLLVETGQKDSAVGDWKVGREKSGLFLSPPIWSGLCFLITIVTSITTVLVGQPLLRCPSSSLCGDTLCSPCCSISHCYSGSLTSIFGFINLFHILVNILLGLLRSHLCIICVWQDSDCYRKKWNKIGVNGEISGERKSAVTFLERFFIFGYMQWWGAGLLRKVIWGRTLII